MDAFRAKLEIFLIFASIHRIHSLNQGRDNFFLLKKCAQSIPHIKLPLNGCFQGETRNFFDFRVNTPNPFPESGSRKRFHASGMRAIDFLHKITLIWVIFSKQIFWSQKIFRTPKITKMHFFDSPCNYMIWKKFSHRHF
jgi:hypothetical protein